MATTVERITEHNSLWHWKGQADYVDSWFLLVTPYPVFIIVISYLVFVLKVGPEYMRQRPPYRLRRTLLAYNGLQVMFSVFLVYNGVCFVYKYGLFHRTCIVDDEDIRKELLSRCYWYFLAKVTELLDTIFFVLRKKQSHVTFLHVYHHTLVVVMSWFLMKYSRTDDLVFVGTMNSFVHILMYAYYGLSAVPQIAKLLWWKKYITTLQMIQFVLTLIHFPINTMISQCKPSLVMMALVLFNGVLFLYLFCDFYQKRYGKRDCIKKGSNAESVLQKIL